MALPKDVRFVTFDCYGTLVDWEEGAWLAFNAEAARDGATLDREKLIADFLEIQREIQGGSYELYAEVLRRAAVRCARRQGWSLEPARSRFLPASVEGWPLFGETNRTLARMSRKCSIGLLSNVDDKLLGHTRRQVLADFDLVVTSQQVRSYKPEPAHFRECQRRVGGKRGWVHVASGYHADVAPCIKLRIPVIWLNRKGIQLEPGQRKPDAIAKTLTEVARLLKT